MKIWRVTGYPRGIMPSPAFLFAAPDETSARQIARDTLGRRGANVAFDLAEDGT